MDGRRHHRYCQARRENRDLRDRLWFQAKDSQESSKGSSFVFVFVSRSRVSPECTCDPKQAWLDLEISPFPQVPTYGIPAHCFPMKRTRPEKGHLACRRAPASWASQGLRQRCDQRRDAARRGSGARRGPAIAGEDLKAHTQPPQGRGLRMVAFDVTQDTGTRQSEVIRSSVRQTAPERDKSLGVAR